MKILFAIVGITVLAGLLSTTSLKAQQSSSSSIYPEIAAGLDASRPDLPSRDVPQTSTQYAIKGLLRTETNHAGAEMKDSKEMQGVSAPSTEEGFSAPTAYSEYKFTQIQDDRLVGFDGPQHTGVVGFDFESYYKTIVGFNFTYTNANLDAGSSVGPGSQFFNSSNSYFFSPYIARNFCDWINVGGSFTYGRTDSAFQLKNSTPGVDLSQDTTQDSYDLSPFIGIAHTYGAWSFSSTTSYVWGYDHYSFDPQGPSAFGPAAPDAKTLNQTFLWLNNVQYAVTDKLSLSVQANWTRLLTTQGVAIAPGTTANAVSHQWMSFGGRADYSFNKDGSIFAAFEHDAFNTHFDDYRIRTGISYNF